VDAPPSPPSCPWCDASLPPSAERVAGLLRCPQCGTLVTVPRPDDAELERAYGDWYRPESGRFAGPLDALLRRTRARLAAHIDAVAPPGPVLDVGSGEGVLLDALAAAGREAVGLERHATRANVREAEVTELTGRFAAVVFWHSLEHLRAPGAAVRHAAGLLAEGGLLVVAVPNADSLQARIFGERWLALDLPRHLVHLPAATLVRGVEAAGLAVARVSHWRGGQALFGMLHGLVGLLPGGPDLYDAIRRPAARRVPLGAARRAGTLAAAVLLLPAAVVLCGIEIALRRGGSVYLEATLPPP
jgi:SAM-dependent methyltransferase